jgi:hypothetical protein
MDTIAALMAVTTLTTATSAPPPRKKSITDNISELPFLLICKPEQSGKTFIMIQQLISDLHEPDEQGRTTINFIFCDNSLLLTKQTSERIDGDLKNFVAEDGKTYVEFSSRPGNEYNCRAAVSEAILVDDVTNLVCCTNATRITDVDKIIRRLTKSKQQRGKFIFKIWLDEADKFVSPIKKKFIPLLRDLDGSVELKCLTATPDSLFKKFHGINVFPLERTTTDAYHGWNDNIKNIVTNNDGTTAGFVDQILDANRGLIVPGKNWYVPADREKRNHNLIKTILNGYGFAVFVVNGDGLKLSIPQMSHIIEDKNKELNKQILEMCGKFNILGKFPIAVTGNICVGRGISIMSEDFIFEYGIFSSCVKKAEVSQNAGRLKGNIKKWASYKKPVVFTTQRFDTIAQEWEEKSRRLAVLASERKADGESTVISSSDYKTMGDPYDYVCHPVPFNTMDDVRIFLAQEHIWKTKMRLERAPQPRGSPASLREQCGGFEVTTKLLKKGETKATLTKESRLTKTIVDGIAPGSCISTTKKGSRFLVLPYYENSDSPATDVKYQLRYLCYK